MANFKFMISSLFLVLLVISHEIQYSEGRQLKLGMKKGSPELETDDHIKIMGKETITRVMVESQPPPSRQVEAFRPTAPGHSPGVGHSFLQN